MYGQSSPSSLTISETKAFVKQWTQWTMSLHRQAHSPKCSHSAEWQSVFPLSAPPITPALRMIWMLSHLAPKLLLVNDLENMSSSMESAESRRALNQAFPMQSKHSLIPHALTTCYFSQLFSHYKSCVNRWAYLFGLRVILSQNLAHIVHTDNYKYLYLPSNILSI